MPRTPHMLPPGFNLRRPGLVRPVRVDPAGDLGPTPSRRAVRTGGERARGSTSRHRCPTRTSTSGSSRPPHRLGRTSAVTGLGGAALAGGGLVRRSRRTTGGTVLTVGLTSVQRCGPGADRARSVTGERIPPTVRIVVDGLDVTPGLRRCLRDAVRRRRCGAAVRAFDMAADADLVSLDELLAHLERSTGGPGSRRRGRSPARRREHLVAAGGRRTPGVGARPGPRCAPGQPPGLRPARVATSAPRTCSTSTAGLVVRVRRGSCTSPARSAPRTCAARTTSGGVGLDCLELVSADRPDHRPARARRGEARSRALTAPASAAGPSCRRPGGSRPTPSRSGGRSTPASRTGCSPTAGRA